MGDQPGAEDALEELRRERAALAAEVERLRRELAEARETLTCQDAARPSENLGHADELAASAAQTAAAAAEIDARATWKQAAEPRASPGRHIA